MSPYSFFFLFTFPVLRDFLWSWQPCTSFSVWSLFFCLPPGQEMRKPRFLSSQPCPPNRPESSAQLPSFYARPLSTEGRPAKRRKMWRSQQNIFSLHPAFLQVRHIFLWNLKKQKFDTMLSLQRSSNLPGHLTPWFARPVPASRGHIHQRSLSNSTSEGEDERSFYDEFPMQERTSFRHRYPPTYKKRVLKAAAADVVQQQQQSSCLGDDDISLPAGKC